MNKRPAIPINRLFVRRGAALFALTVLAIVDFFAFPYGQPPAGRTANMAQNGLWLDFAWVAGKYGAADTRHLTQRLADAQMRFAYFHVPGVQADGTLRVHDAQSARRLTDTLHRAAPHVQAIAWVYAGNENGMGHVDLSRSAVRAKMAQEAAWLVNVCGFDGVQWDYEICPDRDAGFLALLQETRAAVGPHKLLSVDTPLWLPHTVGPHGWSDAYFVRVAALCDQMCVMAYDAACPSPRVYVWLVGQQVPHITRDAAHGNPHCRVLVGVPTYARGGLSHNLYIENIGIALRGVRAGCANPQANLSAFAGVAVFADYTTQPDEWATYRALWPK